MDWMFQLSEWARATLGQVGSTPVTLPFAFLLGLASAVASSCCAFLSWVLSLDMLECRRISISVQIYSSLLFMIGTIISLLILGSVAGLIGQVAQTVLGDYWKIFAGIIAIFVGLGAMNLLPFKIPGSKGKLLQTRKRGLLEAAIVGFVMGAE